MTIGVVVFDLRNRFFSQMVNALELSARNAGYFVYLTLTDKDPTIERECIEHLVDRRVDGLIVCSVNRDPNYAPYLQQLKIPIVTVGNRVSSEFTFVGIDDAAAMDDAVQLLAARGYERIIYLSPPLKYVGMANIYAQEQRYLGFQTGLARVGLEGQAHIFREKRFAPLFDDLTFAADAKTVVLCSSDTYALRVLRYLALRRVRVPEDVGVMGFDNIDILEYVTPALATVDYPLQGIGEKAVDALVAQIETGQFRSEDAVFDHQILPGTSLRDANEADGRLRA